MLSLLLVVSLILPSFSSLAGPGAASSDVGDHKIPVNSPHIPMKGMNLLVSLVEVDNTAYKYQAAIEAHNASMPTDPWSEMQISVVDNHLYDYPVDMIRNENVKNGAVIRLNRKSIQPMLFADATGVVNPRFGCKNIYSCDGKTAPTDFSSIDIIGSAIKSNPTYFNAFKNGQMPLELVKDLVQANESKAKVWADKFVALWANMENADDVINAIYNGADSAYYENQLRYLDLLVAVNYLCNGGQEDKLVSCAAAS